MKLRIVPASSGIVWVKAGIQLFWRRPLALASLFFFSMVVMSLVSAVPLIGVVLALVLLPCITLAMMVASGEVLQGRTPPLRTLLTAFQSGPERMRSILSLGGIYALLFVGVMGLSALFDGGDFARVYFGGQPLTKEMADNPGFQQAMLITTLLYVPLSLLFWHAPGLVYWHGVPPVKSMFFSVVACVRNIGAFMLYWAGWVVVFIAGGIALGLIGAVLSMLGLVSMSSAPMVLGGTMMVMAMVLAAMFFASIVFTFRDCFEAPSAAARYAEHAAMAQGMQHDDQDDHGVVDARERISAPDQTPEQSSTIPEEGHATGQDAAQAPSATRPTPAPTSSSPSHPSVPPPPSSGG